MSDSTNQVFIQINEGPDGAKLDGIPTDVWNRFREHAKNQFPSAGDDAWAQFLSEVILAVAGGTTGENAVATYFMTDIPKANYVALAERLESAQLKFEELHARMLVSATVDKALRVIAFNDPSKPVMEQFPGIFIVTGLKTDAFTRFEENNKGNDGKPYSFEHLMAAFFNAAMNGTVKLSNTDDIPADMPKEVLAA